MADTQDFTLKQTAAAIVGTLLLIIITLITVSDVHIEMVWFAYFAAISIPSWIAAVSIDAFKKKHKYGPAASGVASLIGGVTTLLAFGFLIANISRIAGFIFVVLGFIWACVAFKMAASIK
jgi:hypothetical protein